MARPCHQLFVMQKNLLFFFHDNRKRHVTQQTNCPTLQLTFRSCWNVGSKRLGCTGTHPCLAHLKRANLSISLPLPPPCHAQAPNIWHMSPSCCRLPGTDSWPQGVYLVPGLRFSSPPSGDLQVLQNGE